MDTINKNYQSAQDIYYSYGVDTEKALEILEEIPLSIHAWQGDDVTGFEGTGHALTGGCQVTGNYLGKARNSAELRKDLELALSLIPGHHRIGLQGHQVDRMFRGINRNEFTIKNFSDWLDWAKERKIGLDIAPAFYSHSKLDHSLSLSHPDAKIRRFWIEHGQAIRRIAAQFGKELKTPAVCNFWAPDGFKDTPANRYAPRERLKMSLDEIFNDQLSDKYIRDTVESKLFGIGSESYTVGSHEFYLAYAMKSGKMICLDSGHFHPTESIGDKISAILCFQDELLLHVSRGVRWDSDHVLIINDELLNIAREIVAYNFWARVRIALDYFDGSINRIAAWVIGARNMLKALLIGLLEPGIQLQKFEKKWDFSNRLALQEETKSLPWGAVWNYYCNKNNVLLGINFMKKIMEYEKNELAKRR